MSQPARAIHRADYQASPWRCSHVDLVLRIFPDYTEVEAALNLQRVEATDQAPLVLNGEGMALQSLLVDGQPWPEALIKLDTQALTLHGLGAQVQLRTVGRINPVANTALSGLYCSRGIWVTQCEAHGFRRMTWFLDRPDVLSRYRCRIEAPKAQCPVLLSNGNRLDAGELPEGRHFVVWEDPHLKPCYLFAAVAGDLRVHRGTFRTGQNREVRLEIWVEPGNEDRCAHALESLQAAMRWDEQRFGLCYDLDIYMIVAVSDFNMGAMENKGLNVFNAKYVLASTDTATDNDYEHIAAVIAHEYFHNWTGNRVTCRDWFQLTLKEGLTVFRDQEFTADTTDRGVKRIDDVNALRARQFSQDSGPMAHPIRPQSYLSMDNFYTATVYEKGAEVVRLYQTILGKAGFRAGMDLYFQRHDGQAVTCDDFRAAMADANQVDLSLMERWYDQAGTPRLRVSETWEAGIFTLRFQQSYDDIPQTKGNKPVPLPVVMGFVSSSGQPLPVQTDHPSLRQVDGQDLLLLTEAETTVRFTGLQERPIPSLLRGFSAPVRLVQERSAQELGVLAAHDPDHFNRFQAMQDLAQRILLRAIAAGGTLSLDEDLKAYAKAWAAALADGNLDGAYASCLLTPPGSRVLAAEVAVLDAAAIDAAVRALRLFLVQKARVYVLQRYLGLLTPARHAAGHVGIAARRLRNTLLGFLCAEPEGHTLAWAQYQDAQTMTERECALMLLCDGEHSARVDALGDFAQRFGADALVMDKWLVAQAVSRRADTVAVLTQLLADGRIDVRNPNRLYSGVGSFAHGNLLRFHAADGSGYQFLANIVERIQAANPQVASRLVQAFNQHARCPHVLGDMQRKHLQHFLTLSDLSTDVREVVERALA